ncbi:indole-3-glycerol phosphate synthase TrpC [Lachnoclostridium phytofermentans]|uniref:Indole-3-glycerol phosphate synthase n=1 Tax=Lachnoclostridium phytofermentans (strain ATCC 700394 / DSM 18823 / ISDg) TaxID=357809 RepID=TRPC_LACP7|nr:indole-3-glycerol phosphate synthase TrpC [Lachnoclostridium phytofermentans]A9KL43.1 RecName: Full=Indole-3-glycerol phosphate synthase; Short=IGPS [Lachnoclostridium phytofermentans ISDg]ABX44192.1 Indole-3-glycerol-phosphate synthase [Lachnoclostridium phytofermentans ISDg]
MILEKIVETTKDRINQEKRRLPEEVIKKSATEMAIKQGFGSSSSISRDKFFFEEVMSRPGVNFLCEIKRASPSKGMIAKDFDPVFIAKEYEEGGAAAISVLTEPTFFLGKDDYLMEVKKEVGIPVLRKDFILEAYQIYQAKLLGADCVLLIVSILTEEQLTGFLKICDELGLSALVETHNQEEVMRALQCGARIIGVNNRNLSTFEVSIENSLKLRTLVPKEAIFIAESGISTPEQIKELKEAGVNGVLIGETLMKASNKKLMIRNLKSLL